MSDVQLVKVYFVSLWRSQPLVFFYSFSRSSSVNCHLVCFLRTKKQKKHLASVRQNLIPPLMTNQWGESAQFILSQSYQSYAQLSESWKCDQSSHIPVIPQQSHSQFIKWELLTQKNLITIVFVLSWSPQGLVAKIPFLVSFISLSSLNAPWDYFF